jgi:hypothetical protein
MAVPTDLQRRAGGRLQFQLRLRKSLATNLGQSHLRFALRTTDSREARRRVAESLDWTFEFWDAPDFVGKGEALTRKLAAFAADGPPPTREALEDRRFFEDITARFISQAREREFAWVRDVPGLLHLFKVFTEQNITAEKRAFTLMAPNAQPSAAPAPSPGVDLMPPGRDFAPVLLTICTRCFSPRGLD